MADLADPGAGLAVRGRVLSARHPARVDAGDRACARTVLRVRGHARDRLHQTFSASHLLWAMGLAALYILLATVFFVRVYRHAVRTGLLARYSAESAS